MAKSVEDVRDGLRSGEVNLHPPSPTNRPPSPPRAASPPSSSSSSTSAVLSHQGMATEGDKSRKMPSSVSSPMVLLKTKSISPRNNDK